MKKTVLYVCVFLTNIVLCLYTHAMNKSVIPDFARPPESQYNSIMNNFKRNAHCKISPTSKVLLAVPQDRDFEKKYVVDDEEILRLQCEKWVMMDIYIQNTSGIMKVSQRATTTFPACEALPVEVMLWGTYWAPRDRNALVPISWNEILIAGTFFSTPLVLTKDSTILSGTYSLTQETTPFSQDTLQVDEGIDILPLSFGTDGKVQKGNTGPSVYYKLPPITINVSDLPECEPNIRLKK